MRSRATNCQRAAADAVEQPDAQPFDELIDELGHIDALKAREQGLGEHQQDERCQHRSQSEADLRTQQAREN